MSVAARLFLSSEHRLIELVVDAVCDVTAILAPSLARDTCLHLTDIKFYFASCFRSLLTSRLLFYWTRLFRFSIWIVVCYCSSALECR